MDRSINIFHTWSVFRSWLYVVPQLTVPLFTSPETGSRQLKEHVPSDCTEIYTYMLRIILPSANSSKNVYKRVVGNTEIYWYAEAFSYLLRDILINFYKKNKLHLAMRGNCLEDELSKLLICLFYMGNFYDLYGIFFPIYLPPPLCKIYIYTVIMIPIGKFNWILLYFFCDVHTLQWGIYL